MLDTNLSYKFEKLRPALTALLANAGFKRSARISDHSKVRDSQSSGFDIYVPAELSETLQECLTQAEISYTETSHGDGSQRFNLPPDGRDIERNLTAEKFDALVAAVNAAAGIATPIPEVKVPPSLEQINDMIAAAAQGLNPREKAALFAGILHPMVKQFDPTSPEGLTLEKAALTVTAARFR